MGVRACIVAIGDVGVSAPGRVNLDYIPAAHKLWGHRVLDMADRIGPIGMPIRPGRGPLRQFLLCAVSTCRPATLDAPLCRLTCPPAPPTLVGPMFVLSQESRRDDVNAAVQDAVTRCRVGGAQVAVDTAHYAPGREPGQYTPTTEPLVSFTLHWNGTSDALRALVRDALLELQRTLSPFCQPTRWATWATLDDLNGAVIFPASKLSVCAVAAQWQEAAASFGGRVLVTSTGIAMTGAPPLVAQTWVEAHGHRMPTFHAPMRVLAYDPDDGAGHRRIADSLPEAKRWDFRLASPAAGQDLVWLVHTAGQHTLAAVGRAVFDVLGEATANVAVRAWHPRQHRFDDMVQISLPSHLRRPMELGPGASGQLQVDGRNLALFPFTHYSDRPLGQVPDPNAVAQDVHDAARRTPMVASRTTMVALAVARRSRLDHAPTSAGARDQAARRGLYTTHFMNLGEGTWAQAHTSEAVAASVEASFTRTRLDVKLLPTTPHQRQAAYAPPALTPEEADALAAQPWYPHDMWQREMDVGGAADAHAPLDVQLAPGDFVLAMAPAGAVIELAGPTETLTVSLPHPAWTLVTHPKGTALRAAVEGAHAFVSLTIRQVVGTWMHCKRIVGSAAVACDAAQPTDGMHVDAASRTTTSARGRRRCRLCG